MNVVDECSVQWKGFCHALEYGRLAHAYVLVGDPRGIGRRFAEAVLELLFEADGRPELMERLQNGAHPDVIWLEPQSKSRQISIDAIRHLNRRLQQTASEGEWKVAVILGADRMTDSAANAFLKSLEEPSGQTLMLLVTDAEQALLPTISSRCHRVVLSFQEPELQGEWREPTLEVLRSFGGQDPMDVFLGADALANVLKNTKSRIEKEMKSEFDKEAEDSDVFDARVSAALKEQQAAILKLLLAWQRDLLYFSLDVGHSDCLRFPEEADVLREQASRLSYEVCIRRIRAVEDMARRLDRHLPPALVFEAGLATQLGRKRSS